ncbi:MAG: ribosome silencing factor [Aquificae bacterium]|nr:ribosome silencing factor [Aquificota bacterium]
MSIKNNESTDILNKIVKAASDKKGEDIVVLEIGKVNPIMDYMVIVSGTVPVHTQAIVDEIVKSLKDSDIEPFHVEGYSEGRWIAIDLGDIMVNVFLPEVRDYYQLEWLWADAPKTKVNSSSG